MAWREGPYGHAREPACCGSRYGRGQLEDSALVARARSENGAATDVLVFVGGIPRQAFEVGERNRELCRAKPVAEHSTNVCGGVNGTSTPRGSRLFFPTSLSSRPNNWRHILRSKGLMAVKKARERIEDAMREVGTLLIAFAPLDAALSEGRGQMNTLAFLLLFFGLGSLLFVGAVLLERRRSRVS